MKKFDTLKLFWDKYLYKISIHNTLSPIFRSKNLSYARQVLDELQYSYEVGDPLIQKKFKRQILVKEEAFLDAKKIFSHLSKKEDFLLRIEGLELSVYSNNLSFLKKIISDISQNNVIGIWEPNKNVEKLLSPNVIFVNFDIEYNYKVTLGNGIADTSGFANWVKNNPKQIKLGNTILNELSNNGYVNNMYFYARDEKTIQLCNLMLDNIRRIDKIITTHNIDK